MTGYVPPQLTGGARPMLNPNAPNDVPLEDPSNWLDTILSTAFHPVAVGLQGLGTALDYGIERPLAAAWLASNPSSQDFLNPLRAYRAAATVSPGQAFISNPFSGPIGQLGRVGTHNLGDPVGIDPTDPRVRAQAFNDNIVGRVTSGGIDGVVDWYANPGIPGKALLDTVRNTRIADDTIRAGEAAKLGQEAAARTAAETTGTPLTSPTEVGRVASQVFDNRGDHGYLSAWLRQMRVGNVGALASVLGQAKDFDEFSTALMAARGDITAATKFATQWPSAYQDYLRAVQTAQIPDAVIAKAGMTRINGDGTVTHDWELTPAIKAENKQYVTDALARNNWLAQAVGLGKESPGIYDTMSARGIADRRAVNAYRDFAARVRGSSLGVGDADRGAWVTRTFTPNGGAGAAIRVFNWFGSEVPSGWVGVAGNAALEGRHEVAAFTRQAKMTNERATYWTQQFDQAVSANDKVQVVERMKQDAVRQVFTRAVPDIDLTTDAGKAQYEVLMKNAQAFVTQHGLSVRKALATLHDGDGYLYDALADEHISAQALINQAAQGMVLPDMGRLEKALKYISRDDAYRLRTDALTGAEQLSDLFADLWKPAVLLRLGALPRNLGETWLASMVGLSRLPGNPVTGAGHIAVNRFNAVLDKYRVAGTGKLSFAATRMPAQDVYDAALGNVAAYTGRLADDHQMMADLIASTRATGGDAYYAAGPAVPGARQLTHAEVADAVAASTTSSHVLAGQANRDRYAALRRKSLNYHLDPNERLEYGQLHHEATQGYLRRLSRQGSDVVSLDSKGGWSLLDDINDLQPEQAITPGRLAKARGGYPNPDLHVVPRYKGVMKAADKPLVAAKASDLSSVYDSDVRTQLEALATKTDAIKEQIEQFREQAAIVAEHMKPKARLTGAAPTISTARLRAVGIEALGPEADPISLIAQASTSARTKNMLQIHAADSTAHQALGYGRMLRVTGRTVAVNPDDPNYFQNLAHFMNTNVRIGGAEGLSMRLLMDQPLEDVAAYLKTDAGLGEVMRHPDLRYADDQQTMAYLVNTKANLHALIPNDQLVGRLVDHEITANEAKAYLGHRDDLVPVHDDEVSPDFRGGISDTINRFIDKAFEKIWSQPEDRLGRFPLYNAIYTDNVKRLLAQHEDRILAMTDPVAQKDFITKYVQAPSAERALTRTRNIVYTADRRVTPADKLRLASPFYQVTANRLSYYGSQILDNPQNMWRVLAGWNSIATTKDSQGNDVLTFHLPGWVAEKMGIPDDARVSIQKSGLNLINNGEPWYSPGFGPPVAIAAATYLRDNPDAPAWLTHLVGNKGLGITPNNYYGNDAWDLVLPTWARRLRSSDGQQYVNTFSQIMVKEQWNYDQGLRKTQPTRQEIQDRTNALWGFRVLAGFVSPVQPQLSDATIGPMLDKYRSYQTRFGKEADNRFYSDFPQFYDYVTNLSKNPTGGLATPSVVGRQKQYGDLIADLPNEAMASMVTNLPKDAGVFDSASYNWQYGRQVAPGSDEVFRASEGDAANAMKARVISRGWIQYANLTKQRDALLAQAFPGDSRPAATLMNLKAAAWIKNIYDAGFKRITADTTAPDASGHPVSPWFEDFSTQDNAFYAKNADTLRRIITAPGYYQKNLVAQPWLATAKAYLELRDQVAGQLAQAKAAGGSSSLGAKSNAWLRNIWEAQTTMLRNSDGQWADWANRFFAHDDLVEIPLTGSQEAS